jgi:hypothetical protein
LGRTVAELLYGSSTFNPISAQELSEWEALERLRVWEQEQANKKR